MRCPPGVAPRARVDARPDRGTVGSLWLHTRAGPGISQETPADLRHLARDFGQTSNSPQSRAGRRFRRPVDNARTIAALHGFRRSCWVAFSWFVRTPGEGEA